MGHLTKRKEWTLAELCAMPDCREAAEKSGGQFYYTGESCKRGHYMSPRLTNSTACVECKRELRTSTASQAREGQQLAALRGESTTTTLS